MGRIAAAWTRESNYPAAKAFLGKPVDEDSYGYPTIDMGVDGVLFFNACVDSQENGNAWVKLAR
jgi:hypothetical protein